MFLSSTHKCAHNPSLKTMNVDNIRVNRENQGGLFTEQFDLLCVTEQFDLLCEIFGVATPTLKSTECSQRKIMCIIERISSASA